VGKYNYEITRGDSWSISINYKPGDVAYVWDADDQVDIMVRVSPDGERIYWLSSGGGGDALLTLSAGGNVAGTVPAAETQTWDFGHAEYDVQLTDSSTSPATVTTFLGGLVILVKDRTYT